MNNLERSIYGLFGTFHHVFVRVGNDELHVVAKENMEEKTRRDTVSRCVMKQSLVVSFRHRHADSRIQVP
jgi:hypothetical protein